jgi:hypothetical protein
MTAVLEWLRRVSPLVDGPTRERREKEAVVRRLRRELTNFEERLGQAALLLEEATTAEADAEQACTIAVEPRDLELARARHELARRGRRYAGSGFELARRHVALRSGVLHQLEAELAEPEPE